MDVYETFENLRMYIEKNGRPYNYLDSFDKLYGKYDNHYKVKI